MDSINPAQFLPFKPAANFNFGNLQKVWKDILEDSRQYFADWKFPFEQWTGDKGYLKVGLFHDRVKRDYHQESFGNFGEVGLKYFVDWPQYWSDVFASEGHPIIPGNIDVNYKGDQEILAWYSMTEMPLTSFLESDRRRAL